MNADNKPSFRDYIRKNVMSADERHLAPAIQSIADAAVAYGMTGIPVFPCDANKQPLTAHGFKNATTDPVLIRAAFTNPRAVMIGMPTGAITGVVVVDVDRKQGRDGGKWLDANSHRLVQTRTVSTGSGGLHLYFKHPGQKVQNQNDKRVPGPGPVHERPYVIGEGIDVRGDGGYVILPPSPGYTLVPGCDEPADIPDWLLPLLCPPAPVAAVTPPPPRSQAGGLPPPPTTERETYGESALTRECDAVRSAPFGQQEFTLNAACVKIGGLIAGGEIREYTAKLALYAAAESMPSQQGREPWNVNKLHAKIDKAMRDGSATPRSAPERSIPIEVNPAAALIERINREHAQTLNKPLPVSSDLLDVDGVLKMLVDEATRTAQRPQPFLALGAAICAVGVLAGRRYRNRTDLRTNLYIGAIAESGGGKDHATDILRRAFFAAGLERYLGGESLASGRAISASLEQHPARLFMIDEFGMFLKTVLGQKAAAHKADIWAEFTKLFSRARGVMGGTEYANQKENARVNIYNPHACFYGTSTPSTFWSALSGSDAMNDGGLARFLLFQADEARPKRQYENGQFEPSADLIEKLALIAAGAAGHDYGGNLSEMMSATVPMLAYAVPETPGATVLRRRHGDEEDAWMRKVAGTPAAASVARLAEKADQIALIRAVSRNPASPVITEIDVAWSWALTVHCTRSLLDGAGRLLATNEFEAKMQRVREIIRNHGPISEAFIIRRGFKAPARERTEVLQSLLDGGYIAVLPQGPGQKTGRPTLKYVAAGGDTLDCGTDTEGADDE